MTDSTLAQALAAANTELTNPHKDAKADTGTYGYSYATLDSVTALVRPVLARHGISVLQDPKITDEGRLAVTTTLLHTSGETMVFGPLVGPLGSSWQQVGGAISYARRYQLLACLGLAAGDDDDAQQLERQEPARPALIDVGTARGRLARTKATEPATEKQKQLLGILVRKIGYADTTAFLASPQAERILGGTPSDPLLKAHASPLIEACQEHLGREEERPGDGDVPDDLEGLDGYLEGGQA